MARASTLLVFCVACGADPKPVATAKPHEVTIASASASTCADAPPQADKYEPQAAWSGRAANIPDPSTLPTTPLRVGDAYTVYGAARALHSIDANEKLAREITIVGYIVDTNLPRAPKCAVHQTGRADPPGCTSEIPTFTIADDKNAPATAPRIRVMGWASNFANVYDAFVKQRAHSTERMLDELWAHEIPNPLPVAGAKVKLTGRYGAVFSLSSGGIESDPRSGIMTLAHTETLEPAPPLAQLGR